MPIEKYSNVASTTLALSIGSSDTVLTVTDGSTFPSTGNFRIRIDSEIMLVTAVSGNIWTVSRAVETLAGVQSTAVHKASATITHVLTADSVKSFIQWNEIPTGTVDGTNKTFALLGIPTTPTSIILFVNGILQRYLIDYSISTNIITFVAAPQSGDVLTACYSC